MDKMFGEILLDKGLISEDQLSFALMQQKVNGGLLGIIMLEKGWITKNDLIMALKEQGIYLNYGKV